MTAFRPIDDVCAGIMAMASETDGAMRYTIGVDLCKDIAALCTEIRNKTVKDMLPTWEEYDTVIDLLRT